MLVDAIIAELGGITDLQNRVQGSQELSALTKPGVLPQAPVSAFVVSLGINAKPSDRATGIHHQLLTEVVGVMLVVQSPDDPAGNKSRTKVETLVEQVITCLAGAQPDGACSPLDFMRGRLVDMSGGLAFYQIDFSATRFLRKLP